MATNELTITVYIKHKWLCRLGVLLCWLHIRRLGARMVYSSLEVER